MEGCFRCWLGGNRFQRRPYFRHGLKALRRLLGQTPLDMRRMRGRMQRCGFLAQHRVQHLRIESPRTARRPDSISYKHRAETEDVRPRVERLALRLLRRHVGGRAQHRAFHRLSRVIVGSSSELGQSEIEELGRALRRHQNIRRV